MKKLLIVVTSIYFIFSAASAHAASGKAFIPHYESVYATTEVITEFFLSNLTGSPIDVTIKFFKKDNASGSPNVLTDSDNSPTAGVIRNENSTNYTETTSGYSATFTIEPYETSREFLITDSANSVIQGYGVIEWKQDSVVPVGLIAHGKTRYWSSTTGYSHYSIPINGGTPF